MLNIILILLLAHLIGNKLFGNPHSTILSCGLYGFVADSPKKFSWDKFNILGSFNDSRGGDSCGRTHGNVAEWGLNNLSKYGDYVKEMKNSPMNSNVIIGHSRKASSGGRDDKFAQPIIFKSDGDVFSEKYANAPRKYRKWANAMALKHGDEPFIAFAGAHNGTLHNHEELAHKYKIDPTDKNDTTILMEIIFKHGYDVLEKYIGGAALLLYDAFSPDSLTIFKGHSPNYTDATLESEERPLYYWQKSPHSVYVSSLEDPLNFIGGAGSDNIKEVPENLILKITNGLVVQERRIDRSKAGQRVAYSHYRGGNKKHKTTASWEHWNQGTNYNGHNTPGPICSNNRPTGIPKVNLPIAGFGKKKYEDNYKVFSDASKINFDTEKKPDTNMDQIFYWKGRYWVYKTLKQLHDPKLVNGLYHVDFTGTVFNTSTQRGNPYYFLDGMMLRGPESYRKAKEILTKNENKSEATKLQARTLTRRLAAFVALPIHTLNDDLNVQDITEPAVSGSMTGTYYDGSIKPPFSKRIYYVHKGSLIGVEEIPVHNGSTPDIVEEDSYVNPDSIIVTPAIKKFFENNFAFCPDCITPTCDNCVVLDTDKKKEVVPEIAGEIMLDLSGKTVEEIIKANSSYYHDNYDFCEECANLECAGCVVVDAKGTIMPTYNKKSRDSYKDLAVTSSETAAWKLKVEEEKAEREAREAEAEYEGALTGSILEEHMLTEKKLESAENSGQQLELSTRDFSSDDITAGDDIARANLSNILKNVDDALYEIEEEIMVMDRDTITKGLTKVIDSFKDDLTNLKIDLM